MLLNMPRLRTALTAILALTAASASADTFNLRIGSGHPSAQIGRASCRERVCYAV